MTEKISKITVRASDIEAWSTGDGDVLESPLVKELLAASERVSRDNKKQAEVLVEVVP